jgi:ribonuclease HII
MTATPARSLKPDLGYERTLFQAGITSIAGLDEAGRGALAGPVVAGAVILPVGQVNLASQLNGVRDSKVMSPGQRDHWYDVIRELAIAWSTGSSSHQEIDELGIVCATRVAMARALHALAVAPDYLLLDYMLLRTEPQPQTSLVKGDASCLSIAAASVLAKVSRDRAMIAMDRQHPGYGFAQHKGYATAAHRSALAKLGPCPIHRRTFAPVAGQLPLEW